MTRRNINPGILYAVAAHSVWGLLPIFFMLMRPLSPGNILAHRILWSLLLLSAVAAIMRRGPVLATILRQPRILAALAASATLIGGNWLVFIDAVNSHRVADASLGYFINPLINIALGVVVLRERLGRPELFAVLITAAAVAWLAATQGQLPITALVLAGTFGIYGLIRKVTPVEAIDGLLVETALLSPLCIVWLVVAGDDAVGAAPGWSLVIASGIATTVPLVLFAAAANLVRYSDIGLLQYIAPTLQLALAVFVYGEPLPASRLLGFALIWIALVIYATAAVTRSRRKPDVPSRA